MGKISCWKRVNGVCIEQKRCSSNSCRIDCISSPDGFCCIDHALTNTLLQVIGVQPNPLAPDHDICASEGSYTSQSACEEVRYAITLYGRYHYGGANIVYEYNILLIEGLLESPNYTFRYEGSLTQYGEFYRDTYVVLNGADIGRFYGIYSSLNVQIISYRFSDGFPTGLLIPNRRI
jgi:hypothetical protein